MNVILSTIIWAPLLFALVALFLPERTDEERTRDRHHEALPGMNPGIVG